MKKIIFSIIAFATLFNLACNKIEEDDYLIYSGKSGIWETGTPINNPKKCVLLEKYTGMRCSNCPAADTVVATLQSTYKDQLVVVAIHATSLAKPYSNNEDLRTDVGNTWCEYFGVTTLPQGIVNRSSGILAISGVASQIESELSKSQKIAMELNSQYTESSRKAEIEVNMEFLETIPEELSLTLFITEDSIIGKQASGDTHIEGYCYNHVLRKAITDVWGTNIDATGQQNECRKVTFTYKVPTKWNTDSPNEVNVKKCHVVALISAKETKEVLQVAEVDLTK